MDEQPVSVWQRIRAFFVRLDKRVDHHLQGPLRHPLTVIVSVVGLAVVIIGIILIPLPGPGWAIVFLGLAILGKVFPPAQRLLHWFEHKGQLAWRRCRAYIRLMKQRRNNSKR